MRTKLKTDRGVAGLSIMLSLVTMLFVIGLIVMIFALMGSELRDATYTETAVSVVNETGAWLNQTGYTVDGASVNQFANPNLTAVWTTDISGNGVYNVSIAITTNASLSGTGVLRNVTDYTANTNVSVSYNYTYGAGNTVTNVMGNTTDAVGSVVDWYPIFIVIGAMVVLILLTVIIIVAIKGSGMMGDGSA
jgi:hypothetical protein